MSDKLHFTFEPVYERLTKSTLKEINIKSISHNTQCWINNKKSHNVVKQIHRIGSTLLSVCKHCACLYYCMAKRWFLFIYFSLFFFALLFNSKSQCSHLINFFFQWIFKLSTLRKWNRFVEWAHEMIMPHTIRYDTVYDVKSIKFIIVPYKPFIKWK